MRFSTPARSSASVTMSAEAWNAASARGRGPPTDRAAAPCSPMLIA